MLHIYAYVPDARAMTLPSEGRSQYQVLVLRALYVISHHSEMDEAEQTGAFGWSRDSIPAALPF